MKILIVEDETNIREGILNVLHLNLTIPYKLKSCGNALQALSICETFFPDLVITDIVMPDMSGLELIDRLLSLKLCHNFIILSGYDNFSYAQQAIRYHVIDYLLKPLDKEQLLDQIQKIYVRQLNTAPQNARKPFMELEYFQWDPDTPDMPSSLRRILDYIRRNYMKEISLQSISEELFFHASYISSLINKYTGHSFTYLLDYIRIRKSVELLLGEPDMSIAEISDLVGYHNERRLYAAFQKRLQTTPGDFRRLYLSQSPPSAI